MSNLERIRKMKINELIIFLKMCDFTGIHPIIEGRRFYSRDELIKWFNSEAGGSTDV